ncbi:hypothetical protein U9M48_011555 [Paspalum notatum var. saurae]|uniref:Glycine-rich protein n=1 Tax=Paspalum notatum var. saurae TaxID=547442 RepID=A0AAQ3SW17_PASNO
MATPKASAAALLLLALSVPLLSSAAAAAHNPNPDPNAFFAGMPFFGGAGPGGAAPGGGFFGGGWGEGGLGYRRGAVVPPSTVCAQDGPCRGKRLTCPARCFRTFSYRGKNGGGGGGGGGCSFDCTSRCAATC